MRASAGESQLVRVSRISTIVIMALSLIVTMMLDTISGAWTFIIEAGAGLGLVLILRWFWWRINAWSEIAAMVTPLLVYGGFRVFTNIEFPESLFWIVGITTVVWLAVTFVTKPVDEVKLKDFYRRVHPGGKGWKKISDKLPEVQSDSHYATMFINWLSGIVLVYMMLFGVGKLILGQTGEGFVFVAIGLLAGAVIYRNLSRQGFGSLVK